MLSDWRNHHHDRIAVFRKQKDVLWRVAENRIIATRARLPVRCYTLFDGDDELWEQFPCLVLIICSYEIWF